MPDKLPTNSQLMEEGVMMPIQVVEHPAKHFITHSAKMLTSIVAGLATVVTVALAVDSRYVHAQDLKTESLRQQTQVSELQWSMLDDKIFELELRKTSANKTWTSMDQMILERYKARQTAILAIKQAQMRSLQQRSVVAGAQE